jgi:hypothetical protein
VCQDALQCAAEDDSSMIRVEKGHMESRLPMYGDIHCKERGDDTGLGAVLELVPL